MNSHGKTNRVNFKGSYLGVVEPFSGNLGELSGEWRNGTIPVSQSLVLDCEKGELVKAQGKVGKKDGVSEVKTRVAMKNHCEAERRRRERINAHLATLRGLVPCTEKMDKATLLAEVICQVKEFRKAATEASEGLLIPLDADEVQVEALDDGARDGPYSFRASLCCDYRPELISDLRHALDAINVNIVKSEISTLGSRVKNTFVFTSDRESDSGDAETRELIVNSVHRALTAILDKISALPDYSPRSLLPNKRQKVSLSNYSSSSS